MRCVTVVEEALNTECPGAETAGRRRRRLHRRLRGVHRVPARCRLGDDPRRRAAAAGGRAGGPIPEQIEFHRGLGARNRISPLASGPCLVPFVNGVSLTGAILDARYTGGYAGAPLVPDGPGHEGVVAVEWLQVRAVLGATGSPGSGPAPTA